MNKFFIGYDKERDVFVDKNNVYWEGKIVWDIMEKVYQEALKEKLEKEYQNDN